MARRFAVAPMSGGITALTVLALAVPVALLVSALLVPQAAGLGWVVAFMAVIYASVWLWWRPSGFELDASSLVLVFPLRRRTLPLRPITAARRLDRDALYRELGFAIRIGAGGLFGVFGWLWTRRRGLVECYVTRLDALVLIDRDDARPLLVTPADPDAFARALIDSR